jgi:hypothetical protein
MRESSCPGVAGLVGLAGLEHGPEHVDAAAGQGDDGLVVGFALASFAGVEGLAVGARSEQNADW